MRAPVDVDRPFRLNADPQNAEAYYRIARIDLDESMVKTGSNGELVESMTSDEKVLAFIEALMNTGYLLQLIMGVQVIVGVLLLVNCIVPLALTLIAPVIVGIITFRIFLQPSGWPMAALVFFLVIYLAWEYRRAFWPLLAMRVEPGKNGYSYPIKWVIAQIQDKKSRIEVGGCSFCGSRPKISKLVHGPDGIRICNKCLERCDVLFERYENAPPPKKSAALNGDYETFHCSFCGRKENEVKYLLAGKKTSFICVDCARRLLKQIR